MRRADHTRFRDCPHSPRPVTTAAHSSNPCDSRSNSAHIQIPAPDPSRRRLQGYVPFTKGSGLARGLSPLRLREPDPEKRHGGPFGAGTPHFPKLKFSQRFQPYILYCLRVKQTMAYAWEQQDSSPLFHTFVQWCEKHKRSGRQTLGDLLIKPHQRITKYPLLLQAVLKRSPEAHAREALTAMIAAVESFLRHINKRVRQGEEQESLVAAARRIGPYEVLEPPSEEVEKNLRPFSTLDLMAPMLGVASEHTRQLLLEGPARMKEGREGKVALQKLKAEECIQQKRELLALYQDRDGESPGPRPSTPSAEGSESSTEGSNCRTPESSTVIPQLVVTEDTDEDAPSVPDDTSDSGYGTLVPGSPKASHFPPNRLRSRAFRRDPRLTFSTLDLRDVPLHPLPPDPQAPQRRSTPELPEESVQKGGSLPRGDPPTSSEEEDGTSVGENVVVENLHRARLRGQLSPSPTHADSAGESPWDSSGDEEEEEPFLGPGYSPSPHPLRAEDMLREIREELASQRIESAGGQRFY
ncbi:hypothetical protein E2I00_001510 [Balaenoptera physalus]|uniref:DH domain-containing protein n=1 Tax=Balaenoptera physalus TaxID=9770 RepID=A0A643C655_BALPH|nr:hypothetical protein E2I00_001510 [Balaenoptera physalus]